MPARRLALALIAAGALAFAAMAALTLAAPGLDLAVSRWFWNGTSFPVAAWAPARAAREVFRASYHLLALAALAAAFLPRAARLRLPAREAGFVLAAYALGPGLLVNAGLKSFWGRARPREIAEFGGAARFTPPLVPTDQCTRDCSFVSAESAGLAFFAVAVLLLAWPRLRTSAARTGLAAGLALWALSGAWLRIAFGAHFLSDTVFAAALMAMLVPVVWLALGLGRAPVSLPPPAGTPAAPAPPP